MTSQRGHRRWAKRGRTRGQALVELALLLPLLLVLLLGVEELGRMAYTGIAAQDAAHAGALYGAQNSATAVDNAGMVAQALQTGQAVSGLSATATHVCTCASGASAPDCSLSDCVGGRLQVYTQVQTTAAFTPLCSLFGWPGTIALHGQATVRARP